MKLILKYSSFVKEAGKTGGGPPPNPPPELPGDDAVGPPGSLPPRPVSPPSPTRPLPNTWPGAPGPSVPAASPRPRPPPASWPLVTGHQHDHNHDPLPDLTGNHLTKNAPTTTKEMHHYVAHI